MHYGILQWNKRHWCIVLKNMMMMMMMINKRVEVVMFEVRARGLR